MSDDRESRHDHLPTEGGPIFAENGSETVEDGQERSESSECDQGHASRDGEWESDTGIGSRPSFRKALAPNDTRSPKTYFFVMGSENSSLAISVGDGRRSMASVASMAPSGAERIIKIRIVGGIASKVVLPFRWSPSKVAKHIAVSLQCTRIHLHPI